MPHLSFLDPSVVGDCVTLMVLPLSNRIVKGKLVDKNIPKALEKIVIVQSGGNNGLDYPFLSFCLVFDLMQGQ